MDREQIAAIFASIIERLLVSDEPLSKIAEETGVSECTLKLWIAGKVTIPSIGTMLPVGIYLGDVIEYGIKINDKETFWTTFGN